MKRLIFNILLLMFPLICSAQQDWMNKIDSIQSAMAKQEGYEKAETMQELSRAFIDYSFDDCVFWGEKAIKEAEFVQDKFLIAQAYWKLGLSYLDHYDFDLAHSYFEQALLILQNTRDTELKRYILDYKGRVEIFLGDLESALSTYQEALKVSENLGDGLNCADVINNIAYIYFQQDDLNRSLDFFGDARLRYVQLGDTLSATQCDNNISNIYVQWQQYNKAKTILQKAIPLFEQCEDEASLAHAYQNLGTVYASGIVDLDSALFYLQKSIVCAENVGDQITLIEDELELAGVLRQLNREKDAHCILRKQ